MQYMRFSPALRAATLIALLPLAACSESDVEEQDANEETTVDLWGTETTTAAASLNRADVANACESAVEDGFAAEGIDFTSVMVWANDVPEDRISGDLFDGPLEGHLESAEFSGDFTFSCSTNGVTADVYGFDFPASNFVVPDPTPNAAPPPAHTPVVDPQRIDPGNNGAGRAGRDDNLGILYHNREDWRFLEAPGKIVPGARIHNANQNMVCSTGFIASRGDRAFIITAGHCGRVGDQFYVADSQGNTLRIGEMVESYVEGSSTNITGADIGLIELYAEAKPYVDSALPINEPLQGWITPEEAARRDMAICRLGSTTGYSCGVFVEVDKAGQFFYRNINDRGDSGGAIFAYDNSGAWALGVSSRVSDYNKTLAGGMSIAGAIQYWGLTLHG